MRRHFPFFGRDSIRVGDAAPDFATTGHSGEHVALADFRDRQVVVLFFYPRDGSPMCTNEACSFRDTHADFVAAGATVIGVSTDSLERHRQFVDRERLPFLLLSDPQGALRRAYGVPKLFGFLPGRTTFVIDKSGFIRHAFTSHFSSDQHIAEALAVVRKLAADS